MPIGNVGSTLFLRTDKDAPNRKVVAIDLDDPAVRKLRPVIGESESAMESVALIGGELVAQYLVDVQSELHRYALDGTSQGVIELPGTGTVSGLSGRADQAGIWFVFNAPLSPATVYRHDPESGVSTPFDAPAVAFDAAPYQTTAHFARSKDGTRVPYFLTARKDLVRDGSHPTLLYGYGGFSVSTLPTWRTDVLAWLELGGTWVTASLRGGAEYGEAWHEAGMLERKQNVFDDFIAVAEDLVRTRVTGPEHLAIMGGSNGGLLVAAVMNQRPELFAAALPAVGVLDMLRFDRFTGGRLWVSEYGTATRSDQFAFLRAYSPLHNLRSGICYPATLVTTADHDDRVVPSHSFKYTAALQAVQDCARPVLIRVETAGSHGYRPTDRLIAERADQLAFAAAATGLRPSEEDTP
jgi:prolyl oligopeptidase